MSAVFVCMSLIVTLICFGILWFENLWADFYHWGPPFQVGSIVIQTWGRWWVLVSLLVFYQASHVYIEETIGIDVEIKRHKRQPFNANELFILGCYNFYKWLGAVLHILVAVTRIDIWLAIAAVDTGVRLIMWHTSSGRSARSFTA
jgi:hypothetical protein